LTLFFCLLEFQTSDEEVFAAKPFFDNLIAHKQFLNLAKFIFGEFDPGSE
jgi:hypothetical protein